MRIHLQKFQTDLVVTINNPALNVPDASPGFSEKYLLFQLAGSPSPVVPRNPRASSLLLPLLFPLGFLSSDSIAFYHKALPANPSDSLSLHIF